MALRVRGGGDFGGERGTTLLVLDRVAIARMTLPGGMVWSWARILGDEVSVEAKAQLLPGRGFRTGELHGSVGSSVIPVGQGVQINVRATAKHALYYSLGTHPHYIEARHTTASGKPGKLRFRIYHGYSTEKFASIVFWGRDSGGFRGHNFLDIAKNIVLIRRRIARG